MVHLTIPINMWYHHLNHIGIRKMSHPPYTNNYYFYFTTLTIFLHDFSRISRVTSHIYHYHLSIFTMIFLRIRYPPPYSTICYYRKWCYKSPQYGWAGCVAWAWKHSFSLQQSRGLESLCRRRVGYLLWQILGVWWRYHNGIHTQFRGKLFVD